MRPAGLPEGWELDPDVEQVYGDSIGAWWVITDAGVRTAWQDPEVAGNASALICPVCQGKAELQAECDACSGRGIITHIPYADRPWDLMMKDPEHAFGELWLGGIHCQFGGVAMGPGAAGAYQSSEGNCFPGDIFDVVLTLHHNPDYDPAPGVEHHVYRIADADLDPEHHTMLDYLAKRVAMDVLEGKRVLVRCQAGLNRSALICGLALTQHFDLSVDDALLWMRQERSPYVLFNTSFVAYLREVETRG